MTNLFTLRDRLVHVNVDSIDRMTCNNVVKCSTVNFFHHQLIAFDSCFVGKFACAPNLRQ